MTSGLLLAAPPGNGLLAFWKTCLQYPEVRGGESRTPTRGMDRTTFEQIFEHFAPRVRAYLIRQGLNASLADEVAQEVMLTVWHRSDRFDAEKGSIGTWVFAIARNRLIDSIRKQRRPEPNADDPCWVEGSESTPSPESAAAHRGRVESLRRAFSVLPAEQRRVIEALYFEGQSMSELSEKSGIPLGTVKTRARLALRALRGRVGEGNDE
jgi:RNA polymerase sigma-70 factor (ECF subfamily)